MSMVIDAEISIINNPDAELMSEAWMTGSPAIGGTFQPWNTMAILDGGSFWSGGDTFDGGQILTQLMAPDMEIVD